jgi:NADH-quinone oxidoreductase subunit N
MGKFFLFTNALAQGYLTLVIIGTVNTVISIFYYLNIVRMSYTKEAVGSESLSLALSFPQKVVCLIYIAIILYLGVMPSSLMEIFRASITF